MFTKWILVTASRIMSQKGDEKAAAAGGAGGPPAAGDRPLGPDGKPIPGPEQMRQIQAARKMAQQQQQVDEVIGIMGKNIENV